MHGLLILDKPVGLTCQQILSRFRKMFKKIKVGYTGTLDPFATGVLPVFFGEATKLIPYIHESRKTYRATLKLGEATDTLDCDGQVVQTAPIPPLDLEKVETTLSRFIGAHDQRPPAYSAVKIDGIPLYKYARKGIPMEAAARKIAIFSCRPSPLSEEEKGERGTSFERHIRFITEVSRGTYIRVLACEIAQKLGTVGHLTGLCRLKSGPFQIEEAISLENAEVLGRNPEAFQKILKERFFKLLDGFSSVILEATDTAQRFSQGQKVSILPPSPYITQPDDPASPVILKEGESLFLEREGKDSLLLVFHKNRLLGIARMEEERGEKSLKPVRGVGMEMSN